MKKMQVAILNVRYLRIPFTLVMFLLCLSTCISLSTALPPIHLSGQAVGSILCSNTAFIKSDRQSAGVFSLLETVPAADKVTSSVKNVTENTVSEENTLPPENILTKTPSASSLKISNSTNHPINPEDYLAAPPSFLKEDFSVLILHTHTTESYTPSEKFSYVPSDTYRTQDKDYNMVRVGKEIEKVLTSNGIKVYHDTTINDYPSYNGSYNRSSTNASNYIKNDSSIKIVLDVHRDAIEGTNGEKVKYSSTINGKSAASVMLVIGSNLSGLKHDNWESNMQFALHLQQHIESLYPTLCRPINFRSQRFNQQLAPGALIVEVGTNGNTLDEALLGATYFAQALSSYLKS